MKSIQGKFESRITEAMAEKAHESWAGWTRWMLEKWGKTHANGEAYQDRWIRQAATPYDRLSEEEKESDRIEARKWLASYGSILNRLVAEDMVGRGLITPEKAREELLGYAGLNDVDS